MCIFTAALVCQGSDQDSQPDIPKPRCSPSQPTTESENIKASYNGKESQSQSVCQMVMTLYVLVCDCVYCCASVWMVCVCDESTYSTVHRKGYGEPLNGTI